MGQLPEKRVTASIVFEHVGVDFAGPLTILRYRGGGQLTYKAYAWVFVCFATSAVHLELVTEPTTEAFIATFKRFTGRRGIPATIASDHGGNFLGGDTELKGLFQEGRRELSQIKSVLASQGTQWKFIPVRAPHMGGK
uniref:Integrase catalytic domain-containing protein n=1 Tax=Bracon brevicornis TaxID=1563983 RepID=A0A6V7JMH7_9HYME